MSVKVTFDFNNIVEAAEFLRQATPGVMAARTYTPDSAEPIEGECEAIVEHDTPEPAPAAKPSRKASKKRSSKSKTDAPAKTTATKAPDKDAVRKALSAVGASHGIDRVRDICARFGATGLRDLNESQYTDVIAKCEEVTNGN